MRAMDNGWAFGLTGAVLAEFDKTIVKYPNIKRFPGGASNDMIPNLQHPENPVPLMDFKRGQQAAKAVGAED